MSIIHTYLSSDEIRQLSMSDRDYLKRKLKVNCLLSDILNRAINKPLLDELLCILDSKPIPRQGKTRRVRGSDVSVYNAEGKLIRIEYSNGKVKEIL